MKGNVIELAIGVVIVAAFGKIISSLIDDVITPLILKPALEAALEDNWAVVSEGIQTILRRENYPKPYEALKDLTRTGEKINASSMRAFRMPRSFMVPFLIKGLTLCRVSKIILQRTDRDIALDHRFDGIRRRR